MLVFLKLHVLHRQVRDMIHKTTKKYEYIIHYVYIKIKTIKKAHTFTFKHHMHIYMNGHSKKFNH